MFPSISISNLVWIFPKILIFLQKSFFANTFVGFNSKLFKSLTMFLKSYIEDGSWNPGTEFPDAFLFVINSSTPFNILSKLATVIKSDW